MLPTLFLAKYFKEHLQAKMVIPYLLLITSLLLKKELLHFMSIAEIHWYNFMISTVLNLLCLGAFTKFYNQFEKISNSKIS